MKASILKQLEQLTEEEINILEGRHVNKQLYTNNDSNDFVVDSEKFLTDDEHIMIRKHTRFIDFPEHKHNYVECIYVVKGTSIHYFDKERVVLEANDFVILNQNVKHAIEATSEHDILINFVVKPEFFLFVFSLMKQTNLILDFFMKAIYLEKHSGEYIQYHAQKNNDFYHAMNKTLEVLYEKPPLYKLEIQLLMGQLIIELLRDSKNLFFYSIDNYEKNIVLEVVKYIESSYQEGSLEQIASELHLPDYKISRLVTKYTGVSFIQLIQEKRMRTAIELLRTTNYSIVEIANAIGYENITYFYKIFKKFYLVTPKEYQVLYVQAEEKERTIIKDL